MFSLLRCNSCSFAPPLIIPLRVNCKVAAPLLAVHAIGVSAVHGLTLGGRLGYSPPAIVPHSVPGLCTSSVTISNNNHDAGCLHGHGCFGVASYIFLNLIKVLVMERCPGSTLTATARTFSAPMSKNGTTVVLDLCAKSSSGSFFLPYIILLEWWVVDWSIGHAKASGSGAKSCGYSE